MLSNVFRANIFWLSHNPLKVGNSYKIRYGTTEASVTVQSIDNLIDTQDLGQQENANEVGRNAVAEVTLRSHDLLPIDAHEDNAKLGRVVLYEGYDVAGGGLINMDGYPDQRQSKEPKSKNIYKVSHSVTPDMRAERFGHYGGIFWFTGLSGSGKSTLAVAVEKEIFNKNMNAYVLDGDNVRYGLNSDLGFSPEDRAENIRRIGEVAALQANSGTIADLETCETRDPKGLYKKARGGDIKQFTGIDSPYEAPVNPDLVVDTQHNDIDACVQQIVTYIQANVGLKQHQEKELGGDNCVRRIAVEAGNLTLDYFDESGYQGADAKADGSPVTVADQKAEDLITEALKKITHDVLIIGEEAAAADVEDNKARPDLREVEYFWLVDPLDGTKEFISGSGDYTVNIALIKNHVPVLGVVYAPVHGELYAAHGEGTAIRWMEETDKERPIAVREVPDKGLTIVSSKSHGKGERLDKFLENYKIQKQIQRGSSLKICVIAAGKADMYPRFGMTCEWDTAAAHAVLNAAGGTITDIDGNELKYGLGTNEKFLNPEFIARSASVILPEGQE
ncbi:unnamed protein product [Cyprideis torosa]|uniref:3'(2'),5'-bisphosphate nucleotidase 1 n=1 Tax=Cyprideis torosa TaxID=163714 RepID=A0A7R8WSZ2_9CRUS|nr:unnamed protein product [Cyprideis torosa]CAG0905275.1 unnamed protein product [Cyprideis torosa]